MTKLLDELVKPEDINLSSFVVKDHLNSKVWPNEDKINPEIRANLLKIAKDFYGSLGIDWVDIHDIILTGSLANYNWSKFSDLDLHILVPFKEVNKDVDLVKNYFDAKKKEWNDEHDIQMHDFEVEIYLQDTEESHESTGIYSLLNDEWVIKPKEKEVNLAINKIKNKSSCIMGIIDDLTEELEMIDNDVDLLGFILKVNKIKRKIKKMRQAGLERDGEYSYENITFKVLRRTDYIKKLIDLQKEAYDKYMSI